MDASHVFPQDMLATITLVGDVAGDGGARACLEYESGLLLLSGCHFPVRGGVSSQVPGVEALRVGLELAVFLLSVFFFLPKLGSLLKQVKLMCLQRSNALPV